jgi:hypothetical protein
MRDLGIGNQSYSGELSYPCFLPFHFISHWETTAGKECLGHCEQGHWRRCFCVIWRLPTALAHDPFFLICTHAFTHSIGLH